MKSIDIDEQLKLFPYYLNRIPCPYGYVCPYPGLFYPLQCDATFTNQTCYAGTLYGNVNCPNGTICRTPYTAPVPAPPGTYVKKIEYGYNSVDIIGLESCVEGDYCNLARQVSIPPGSSNITSLECPENTYCANASVLEPVICSFNNDSMDYCPKGSSKRALCPAGHYCKDTHTISPCSTTEYCPAGSYMTSVCPAGYYCKTPSEKVACPVGYYCRDGSVEPSKCSIFSTCPVGTKADKLEYMGLVIVLIILVTVTAIYFIYQTAFNFYVKYRMKHAKKSKKKFTFGSRNHPTSPVDEASTLLSQAKHSFSIPEDKFFLDIGFEDLGLVLRGSGKKVLHGVTGEIKHGRLTAVMGLSGAGKSTFITTLSNRGYYGSQIGKTFINGKEEKLSKYNRSIGFVPQDDIMIPTLTVEETLYFSAMTRSDTKVSRKQVEKNVNDVISVLNLEDVRHSIIGDQEQRGISGGQKKRVNVGIEQVCSPSVLFLDEPTSGLDSASSIQVCQGLQEIAKSGTTVITVIHQPRYEVFNMFDDLLLLGKGGRTIYHGQVQRVEEYFDKILKFPKPATSNIADFIIDVSAGMIEKSDDYEFDPATLPDIWEQHKKEYETTISSEFTTSSLVGNSGEYPSINSQQRQSSHLKYRNPRLSYISQFWMCFKRSCTQQIRSLPSLLLDFFLIFLCSSFLGLVYNNKVYIGPPPKGIYDLCPGSLRDVCKQPINDPVSSTSSLITLAMALMASMSALRVFGKESLVFNRESQTGLSTFCYFWAKDISMLLVNIMAPVIFLSIYYTTVSPRAPVYEYYYVLLLVYWCSYGLGYLVSIIIQPNVAMLTAVVLVFTFNTFSGSTVSLPTLKDMTFPINIFPWISYLTYSHENAYLIEIARYKHIYDVSTSLKNLGYDWNDLDMSIYMVVVFGMAFRILAFLALVCAKPSSYFNLIINVIQNFFSTLTRHVIKSVKNSTSSKPVYL